MMRDLNTKKTWAILGGLLALVVALLALAQAEPSDFTQFLGRFHPLLVHLPIGLLLLAVVLEGIARRPRYAHLRQAAPFVLGLGALSAVTAATAGYLLSLSGGYEGSLLTWHKWMGITLAVTAVVAFALALLSQQPGRGALRRAYGGVLTGMLLLLIGAGHFGGSLTHGAGYLTHYLPGPLRALAGTPGSAGNGLPSPEEMGEAVVFTDLIQPIFDKRCVACHGADKRKGGLQLDDPEELLKGGEDGPVLVAGQAAESELVRRILLPSGHEDAMPPGGRQPLSASEAELIRWWIDAGASFDQRVAQAEPTPYVETILDLKTAPGARPTTGVFALDIPFADEQAVAAVQALGISVAPLAEEDPLLQVQVPPSARAFGDAQMDALRPLAPQITWLDLGSTAVGDSGLAMLPDLKHLTRLHLERTRVGDGGLASLATLEHLEYLNLYGTNVSDSGLTHLAGLKNLKALYLWQTQVTKGGAERLQRQLPGLEVDLGLQQPLPEETAATAQESDRAS